MGAGGQEGPAPGHGLPSRERRVQHAPQTHRPGASQAHLCGTRFVQSGAVPTERSGSGPRSGPRPVLVAWLSRHLSRRSGCVLALEVRVSVHVRVCLREQLGTR